MNLDRFILSKRIASRYAASAALLMLSGCGSGDDIGTPQPSTVAYAYVVSAGSTPNSAGAVYEYAIKSDYGVSPLSRASIGAGISPAALVVGHGGAYVVNLGDGTISQYTIEADGTLSPMNPASVTNPGMHTVGVSPVGLTIDPSGNFLYVTNSADGTLSQFSIGSEGQLTPLSPSTVAAGIDPVSIVVAPSGYYVVNSGAAGAAGTVSHYVSGVSGMLTLVDSDTVAAGINPTALVVDSASSTLYVTSSCDGSECEGSIRQLAFGADGALTDTGVIATTGSHDEAVNMVLYQTGSNNYAYLLSNVMGVDTDAGALWQFGIGNSGDLVPVSPPTLNIGLQAVAQAIQVDSLYVLTTNSGTVENSAGPGGNIKFYSLAADGSATLAATTKITAPYPTAMSVVFLLAP